MAVPQAKKSKMRSRRRRAQTTRVHFQQVSSCTNCGYAKPTHRVCPACGFYKGKVVMNVKYRGL